MTKQCETCGREFIRPKSVAYAQFAGRRFCSRTCRRQELKPVIAAVYRSTKRDGRRIDVHRAVMEQHLGRRLTRREFVHHINGDKKDNRLENLMVVTPKQHAVEHGRQKHPLTKQCRVCGCEFTPHPTKRERAKTCSRECRCALLSLTNRRPDAPKSIYRADACPCQVADRKAVPQVAADFIRAYDEVRSETCTRTA